MTSEIQKGTDTRLAQAPVLTPSAHSLKLMQCIARLDFNAKHSSQAELSLHTAAKWELSLRTSELLPKGKPQFTAVVQYPPLAKLVSEHGRALLQKVVFMLIRDFCSSINVVRNMNEDQMIDAAGMLLDECDNFRLEDYVMMFSLAKRGELIKILDRIDMQVIGQLLDAYWLKRNTAGRAAQEAELHAYEQQLKAKNSQPEGDPFPELGVKLQELRKQLREQNEAEKEAEAALQDANRKKYVQGMRERWRDG